MKIETRSLDTALDPGRDCALCPRLVSFRETWRGNEPEWFNAPVPSFIGERPELVVVGLAPGLRGANRTGRPFTGDYAGDLLYATLLKFGLARGQFRADPNDGLQLTRAAITNAVRCVPPENKPLPEEIHACRPYLTRTLTHLHSLRAILVLGRIAHDQTFRTLGLKPSAFTFTHGAAHEVSYAGRTVKLFDSYHCSRYNTNTGRLTPQMFEAVFSDIANYLGPDTRDPA